MPSKLIGTTPEAVAGGVWSRNALILQNLSAGNMAISLNGNLSVSFAAGANKGLILKPDEHLVIPAAGAKVVAVASAAESEIAWEFL